MVLRKYGFGAAVVLCFAVLLVFGCTSQGTTGRAVFGLTDAAMDLQGISKVELTIDQIQVHSTEDGWVTLSSAVKTYDLLKLKSDGTTVLLADVNLKTGSYEQIRLRVSKVSITDANGVFEAKLPSNELKFVGGFDVNNNTVSTATFDFLVDKSLHVTGDNKYILAPVVHLTTLENASVSIGAGNSLKVAGGKSKYDKEVGMDENGNFGHGLGIADGKILEIDNNGKVRSKEKAAGQGRVVVGITDVKGDLNNVTSIMLSIGKIEVHSFDSNGWLTISTAQQNFDLIALNLAQKIQLAADTNVPVGSYDMVRLSVLDVNVTDNNVTTTAKLPSNTLKINSEFKVDANGSAIAVLDFNAGSSLHLTGNGKYILAPVIHVTTFESAGVDIDSNRRINIQRGKSRTDLELGMDVNGNIGAGKKIGKDAKLKITDQNNIIEE